MTLLRASMWALGLVILAGCTFSAHDRARRETVHVNQPQPEYIIVHDAPPPIIVERRPSRPSQGHIWIGGYWDWNDNRYNWHRGHWAVPPHAQTVWIAPRYEKHKQGYRYVRGGWHGARDQKQRKGQQHNRR